MRRVRDVIRMKAAGLPSREIARRMGAAPSTVRLTIRRFEAAGLSWPLPDELTDAALEARLFAKTGNGNRQGHPCGAVGGDRHFLGQFEDDVRLADLPAVGVFLGGRRVLGIPFRSSLIDPIDERLDF